ncbi:Gfo/Idh/MocA family oxidoreductase [Paralimibaculum aggregatum]|uniref:Gfo/Idh/MocA family oxidoreductase n=1 Tax=Paralimibaculum aggregatum TaxID=3036245 RepID=A0ABQ6LS82_9RHOB|nr:Gfo/Idh/MocA family oxidoreductase [Limibaculum sp. NKW23]GMG84610.1 Gfo/Idh/MocA family oxidoreductase [Limibaculum sp. NKW23]
MPEAALPERVRVGVVGAGYFGRFHLDAWARIGGAALVAVAEPDAARAAGALAGLPEGARPRVYPGVAEMLAAEALDLVDITAPPAAHPAILEAVLPRVSHAICQKPFCGGLEAARAASALAARHGTRLAVHENIRFQPWNQAARGLIEAGAIGAPYQVTFRLRPGDGQGARAYLDRQPYFRAMPRFMVHETAVHWIDTFRYLLGEMTGVWAQLRRINPAIAGEDAGVILFDFASGARGLFDGNRCADHGAENRRLTLGEMWIEGAAGTLRLDGAGRLWLRRFGETEEAQQRFAWQDRHFGGDCVHRCAAGILADWRAGRPSPMEAASYIRNQEIEAAVYESAATGRHIPL